MTEIRVPKKIMSGYLSERECRPVRITVYERLGSGWHGTGYRISYVVKGRKQEKQVILRTLRPEGFSHDFPSDRAKVFILQHELAKNIDHHIRSLDVGGYAANGRLISIGDAKEFFQIVEVAEGAPYVDDLSRILRTGKLQAPDKRRAKMLSDYLVRLHAKRFNGSAESSLSIRRRHSRDALGHGEMMMGVIDTYPRKKWIKDKELTDLICLAARFRERIKDVPFIPRRMHGDFHPANIMFKGGEFAVLDASREEFGDPADDVTTLALNYIWFAVRHTGAFRGPFKELFDIFWDNYISRTKDHLITRTAGLYFAFRGVVVIHPHFYKDQSDKVRNKMLRFVKSVLAADRFKPSKINDYLR